MAIVTSQSRLFFRCCSLSLSLSLSGSFPRTNEAAVYSRESTFFNCVPRRQPARGESILAALVVGRIPETRALQKPSNSQKRERERERERERKKDTWKKISRARNGRWPEDASQIRMHAARLVTTFPRSPERPPSASSAGIKGSPR